MSYHVKQPAKLAVKRPAFAQRALVKTMRERGLTKRQAEAVIRCVDDFHAISKTIQNAVAARFVRSVAKAVVR